MLTLNDVVNLVDKQTAATTKGLPELVAPAMRELVASVVSAYGEAIKEAARTIENKALN